MHFCYRRSVVAIQIRDVPEAMRDLLVHEARRRDQSLQAFLYDIVAREAASARNRELLESARENSRQRGSTVNADEILAALAEARESRGA